MERFTSYEYFRVVVSLIGLLGSAVVAYDAWHILLITWKVHRHYRSLHNACVAYTERATTWVLLNAALLTSASASTRLDVIEGPDAATMTRLIAIVVISIIAALAPWRELQRRRELDVIPK